MKKRRLILCSLVSLIMVFVMAVPMTASAARNVAKTGNTEYATLDAAVAAAQDGDTVTLLASTSIDENVIIQKNITLNLAGQTLLANANLQAEGQLNITDTNGGKIILQQDKTQNNNDSASIISKGTDAKITLDKGSVMVIGSFRTGYAFYARDGGTIVINGGTVDAQDAALTGNNTTGDMNFEVNGGVLTAKQGPAIYMPGQISLKITGGTLNGGISLRMGHVVISGGTINAATDNLDDPKDYYSYSGNAWLPDALYVFGGTYTSASGNDLELQITGGTFNCENGKGSGIAIYDIGKTAQKMNTSISGNTVVKTNAKSRDAYQILSLSDIGVDNPKTGYGNAEYTGKAESSISGGTFSSSPVKYVVDGKIAIKFTSGQNENYYVGTEKEIQAIVKDAKADDAIDVLKGSVNLKITTGGVKVTNSGGTVTVNDKAVKQNDTITTADRDIFGDTTVVRYAGATRYDTALETADALKRSLGVDKFNNIIIADGNNYPDALAGSYLAKVKKAPLILVDRSIASENTICEYIDANLTDKGTVYLLGGKNAITQRFEKSLENNKVVRLAGNTRYETNLKILEEANAAKQDLLVCTGEGFADSLSASAVGEPILLVDNSGLLDNQTKYLKKADVKDVYLIGGSDVVKSKIATAMKEYDQDGKVERIAGDNRYKTSVAVAQKFFSDKNDTVVLAYAMNFPDGLAGGPLAMSLDSPLLLVDESGVQDAADYAKTAGVQKAVVLGGEKLISNTSVAKIIQ